jgi:two-component system, NarL family, sensor kinase
MDSISQEVLIIAFSSLFIIVIIIAIINLLLIYQKKQLQYIKEKENIKMLHANELLQTQVEIQEHTLKNVSQEIHDNIGQVLILAKLNLNTFPPLHDTAAETKVNDTRQLVAKAINDLRDLSKSLHGEKIAELGLPESISNELKILQNTGLYQTSFELTGSKYRLPPQKEMVLFRIVQESLHNALKHAKAKNIGVKLQYQPAHFMLTISDDGEGFESATLEAAATGIGLKNMRDRSALIGAKFLIRSSPGNGTFISVEIENPEL